MLLALKNLWKSENETGSEFLNIRQFFNDHDAGFRIWNHVVAYGTMDNDSAAQGVVGEYIESVFSGTAAPASGTIGDATSISLTSGDWDVTYVYNMNNGTVTETSLWISQTSGNSATGQVIGSNGTTTKNAVSINSFGESIANFRISLSATSTVYAKMLFTYSVAPTLSGRISARRVR